MQSLYQHVRGHERLVARILDLMDQSERQYRWIITPFLTPLEQMIAKRVIGHQLFVWMDGGWSGAEMKRLVLCPYELDPVDFEVVCLKAVIRREERTITHRDVLGAILHLGIERDQFGDILVEDGEVFVMVRKELASFLMLELKQIARASTAFSVYEGVVEHENTYAWHTATLSSKRLDCVVAACIRASRTKAETLIKGKCVKVDHLPLEDCKVLCNNNCTVSIRGYGRFLVHITDRTSKKGRWIVEIGAYK